MNEKLLDTLLTYSKEKILKAIDGLLWISLLLISFNRFIKQIEYKTIISPEKLGDYFLSGNYVLIIAWLVCLAAVYFTVKYLFVVAIPKSAFALKVFITYIVPDEYKMPLINVYYKKTIRASQYHLRKATEFWNEGGIATLSQYNEKLNLLFGIVFKISILLFIIIENYRGFRFGVILFPIIVCLLILLFILFSITSINTKKTIGKIIIEGRP